MKLLRRYSELGEKFEPEEVTLKKSLRVNTLRISEEELFKRLKRKKIKLNKIPFTKFGYYYESDFSLGATPEYLQGYYYLQEAASQIPVEVLNPKPGEIVLDMAAAPGSKTTQMAQLMKNKGVIVGLDTNGKRLESLKNNLERLGVKNTVLYRKDGRFASDLGMKFDKILLDAPCSGNFCIEKNYFGKRTEEDFKGRAKTQKQMLKEATKILNPGGILIYSTCSLEPEENEEVINWLLENVKGIKLEKINLDIGDEGLTEVFGKSLNPEVKKTRRFWPHKTGTEGFFIAKIKKE